MAQPLDAAPAHPNRRASDHPRPPKRPRMAPGTPDDYTLVGRDEQIDEIRAALLAGKPRSIIIKLAMGIGKTALACLLANDEALREKFRDGILWANLGKNPDVRQELRRWAQQLLYPDEVNSDTEPDEHGSVGYWQSIVQNALSERRALLVIDDVWDVDSGRAFKIGGNDCAYLFTSRIQEVADNLGGKVVELPPLDTSQGLALLEQFAKNAVRAERDAARALVERVDGLPQALIPIGCFLRKAGGQARQIRDAMAKLDEADASLIFDLEQEPEYGGSLPRSLRSVIEASYAWLGSHDGSQVRRRLRTALVSLSVLRPNPSEFCPDLAASVGMASAKTLDALCEAGLIEARGEHYTMHRTFAEYLRSKLSPGSREELHRRAATFYREYLTELEEDYQARDSAYGKWYRYEDDAWADTMDDWLYHMSRAGEYHSVITAFLRAWFDGFWWWGCFLDFKFCDQLLREWEQRDIRPESREGLQLLARFKEAYPKETEDRSGGDWSAVTDIISEIRSRLGLDSDPPPSDPDARHLRGMTDIFLAEAQRFGERNYPAAEALYRDALAQFVANNDTWDTAWLHYHLADTLLEMERNADARALCEKGLPLGESENDPEVQANLWRVLGDIAMADEDTPKAARHYHQAVFHAYRFQIEPEDPDPYTIRFYVEISTQVAARILAQRPVYAQMLANALRTAWKPYWRDDPVPDLSAALRKQDAPALAALLFPAPLPADMLEARGSVYAAEVSAHLQVMRTSTV